MKLADWLKHNRMTPAAFAELLGVDKSTATRWANEETTPRPAQMRAIKEKTGGAVTADDFVPDVAPRPRSVGRAAA